MVLVWMGSHKHLAEAEGDGEGEAADVEEGG